MLLFGHRAGATTYSLPAALGSGVFSSCSAITRTCSSNIDFGNDNSVVINVTQSMTLTINGNFQAKNNLTLNNGGYTFNLVVSGNVQIDNNLTFGGNITAGGNVQIKNNGFIGGTITADDIDFGSGTTATGPCSPTVTGCGLGSTPTPHHYELSLPTASVACLPTTVTVTACGNSSSPCTSPLTTLSGQTATLATSGGSLGSTTVTFGSGGTATTTLSYSAAGNGTAVTVTLSGESAAASNARQCCANGTSCSAANSCSTTFNTAALIYSASAGGAATTIASQIAGTASGIHYLRAVKSSDSITKACEAALTGSIPVSLGYQCNNPATCSSGNRLDITPYNGGTAQALQTVAPAATTVTLYFDANGNAPLSFTYRDVGQITLTASTNAGGSLLTTLTGLSNAFVVKPYSLLLTDIKQTAAPLTANPAASDASGGRFVRAGESFSATVTALNSSCAGSLATYTLLSSIPVSCITPNYGRETTAETATVTASLVTGLGLTANPAVTNPSAFGAFSGGSATASTLAWGEVGIIRLTPAVGDGSYLGAGAVASPTSTGNVGRFYPDHFGVSAALLNRSDLAAPGGSFTYMDEPFRLTLTLTAYNTADGTTANYAGSFAKLSASGLGTGSNWFDTGCSGTSECMGLGAVSGTTGLSSRLALVGSGSWATVGDPSVSWAGGIGTVTAHLKLTRSAAPDGPFETLKLGALPRDADGVTLPAAASADPHKVDLDATTGTTLASHPDGTVERRQVATTALRFGRLWLGSVYGQDLRDLTLPIRTEYWNGIAFVRNGNDSLTTLPKAAIGLGNHSPAGFSGSFDLSHVPAGPFVVSSGNGAIVLAKPTGTPTSGSVGIVADLGATATPATSVVTATQGPSAGANLGYLRSRWDAATYDRDPTARITFGISSRPGLIYKREAY